MGKHWNSIIMFSRVIESDFARKTFKGKTKDYNYYENYWCSFHYSTIFELATDNPFYKRRKVVFLASPSSWHLPASCFSLNTFVSVSVRWTQVQQRSGTSREWRQPCHSWGFLNGPRKTGKEGFFFHLAPLETVFRLKLIWQQRITSCGPFSPPCSPDPCYLRCGP